MNKKTMKQLGIGLLAASAVISLTACGDSGASSVSGSGATQSPEKETAQATASAKPAEPVSLKFFTNNSDRSTGQGKVEQLLIDQYMKEHPNVKIVVETLSPDPQYQDKIKVYNASNNLPDIISAWGNTNFLTPLVNNNALAEINKNDLAGMDFVPAALDGFSVNGKLYGIPKNSDFFVLYYNKKIFADNGLEPPKTDADLMNVIEKLKAKKITPIALDGRDQWVSGIWFDTMLQRQTGTWDTALKAMDRSGSFQDPAVVAAAAEMQKWVKAGAFGEGFLNMDYGAARNLFGQGKAAMYMMGEWEMGMATEANFADDVKNNMGAIPLPALQNGKGATSDQPAWFGGGYAVSNNSKHKEEAIAFVKWAFQPQGWAKAVWENGVTFPAQKYEKFLTGQENSVQKDLSTIFNSAKTYSGTVSQDKFTPATQKTYYDSITKLESFMITPEDFSKAIDAAADQSAKESASAK